MRDGIMDIPDIPSALGSGLCPLTAPLSKIPGSAPVYRTISYHMSAGNDGRNNFHRSYCGGIIQQANHKLPNT